MLPVTGDVDLAYEDAYGGRTQRRVTLANYSSDGAGYVVGFCHLRGEARTFRLDRVQSAIDIATGEVIPNLGGWLARQHGKSPDRAWERVLAEHRELVQVLLYVATVDGRFLVKERDVILRYVRRWAGGGRLSRQEFEEAVRGISVPSELDFLRICDNLAGAAADTREDLVRTAEAIVATQAKVHPGEAKALQELRQTLRVATPEPISQ